MTDDVLTQPPVEGLTRQRLFELTASPRRYGFHGTLKPPFELTEGRKAGDLDHALWEFAGTQPAFEAGPLDVVSIDGFIALVPALNCPQLKRLADGCVQTFDPFRKPASADEVAARRAHGLTPRQEDYLTQWGYPHVLEEFRFHLTLTERLSGSEHDLLLETLRDRAGRFTLAVDALSIFHQTARSEPFLEIARHPLAG